MRYPDFFIVGAAKAGTTALWKSLGAHPRVFMTSSIENKELSYFCHDYGLKDTQTYLSHFSGASEGQLIGEVCHTYLTSPESPAWIKQIVPNAKIIIILRNPAIRAFSLFQWMVMEGYEPVASFEEALKKEHARISDPALKSKTRTYFRNYFYFHSGLYASQVKGYFDVFGKANSLVLIYEDFKNNPDEGLRKIYTHLGIRESPEPVTSTRIVNESKAVFSPRLQHFLRNDATMLMNRLRVPKSIRKKTLSKLMDLNIRKTEKNEIKESTYRNLIARYREDMTLLGNLINRDLTSVWN